MDIDDWREKIDEINIKILELLNERIEYVIKVGKMKKQKGLPLYSAERENEIFEMLFKANKGHLEEKNIRNIFERIIDESRDLQRKYCK
ncbi:chorismate mutase [candidate division KSB1 bacterium]